MRSVLMIAMLAAAGPATAQSMPEVDAFVQKEMARQSTPGVSIAVVRDGKIASFRDYTDTAAIAGAFAKD